MTLRMHNYSHLSESEAAQTNAEGVADNYVSYS